MRDLSLAVVAADRYILTDVSEESEGSSETLVRIYETTRRHSNGGTVPKQSITKLEHQNYKDVGGRWSKPPKHCNLQLHDPVSLSPEWTV
jgi:hypothetical protein